MVTRQGTARGTARKSAGAIAAARGAFNVVGGLWPLLHLRGFERVFGPKSDDWPQMTTGGLLVSAGLSQLSASSSPQGRAHARRIGLGTALTLLSVDLVYVPKGRIRPTYLLDAVMQIGWISVWLRHDRQTSGRAARSGRR